MLKMRARCILESKWDIVLGVPQLLMRLMGNRIDILVEKLTDYLLVFGTILRIET